MLFPSKPTCHEISSVFRVGRNIEWRPPFRDDETKRGLVYPFRNCSYCGSIHPEDLLTVLKLEGTRIGGADWKYGWPHKFYLDIPNPEKDTLVSVGGRSWTDATGHHREETMGTRETLSMKFYNEHLKDEGFDDEALDAVLAALTERTQIRFQVSIDNDERKLRYAAPYEGFQK